MSALAIEIKSSLRFLLDNVRMHTNCSLCMAGFTLLYVCSGNVVRHVNEVMLSRARLVGLLILVTNFGGSTIPVFVQATQAHSAWPSLRGWVQ